MAVDARFGQEQAVAMDRGPNLAGAGQAKRPLMHRRDHIHQQDGQSGQQQHRADQLRDKSEETPDVMHRLRPPTSSRHDVPSGRLMAGSLANFLRRCSAAAGWGALRRVAPMGGLG